MRLRREFFERRAFASIAAIVIGLLASWRLQIQPGTLGLVHDWSIYPGAQQNVAYAQQLIDGWFRWILGEPVTFPTEYPLRFAFAFAGLLGLGGDVVSHIFVFIVPAAAFFCAWLLARELSGSQAGALAGGALYALSPVMLNKMVSGQAAYVTGYCALPLVLWAYERAVRTQSFYLAAGFGAALAVASIQLQLGLAAALLATFWAVLPQPGARFVKRVALLFTGFGVAAAVHLPTFVGVVGGAPGYENRAQFANATSYVSMNSVSFGDAVKLMGYLSRYMDVAIIGWTWLWNDAMLAVLAAVVVGIIAAPWRFKIFAVVSALCVFALMMGTESPFASAIIWLFAHVRYMEVFRELYHLMAVPALIYACALAFFFKFIRTLPVKYAVYVLITGALFLTSLPMLTGDESGWVRSFSLNGAYGDVLAAKNSGATRVLWLPMDQPLSFDGYGAGVDPMSVTERGSLWDYSLNWPLTAVDSDLHDGGDLETALRALTVGEVVQRDGMESQLARFTIFGIDTLPFLRRSVPIDLPFERRYRRSEVYRVPDPVPFASEPRQIAIVPQRFSVCAQAIVGGYAPVAFGSSRPADLPYTLAYDPQDQPEEALEASDEDTLLPTNNIDARFGFAPVDVWWWHRREYADVPNLTFTFARHAIGVRAPSSMTHAQAVLAWVATPVGGGLRISAGRRNIVVDTSGNGEWRSQAFALGRLRRDALVKIISLDGTAEVAVRGFTLIDETNYARAMQAWRALMHGAARRIALGSAMQTSLVKSGSGGVIGTPPNGETFEFASGAHAKPFVLNEADGHELARIVSRPRIFEGHGLAVTIRGRAPKSWTLYRVRLQRTPIPPAPQGGPHRLLLWNSAYSGNWRVPSNGRLYASAIGTTLVEYPAGAPLVAPSYARTGEFRLAYALGTAVLIFALVASLWRLFRRANVAATMPPNSSEEHA